MNGPPNPLNLLRLPNLSTVDTPFPIAPAPRIRHPLQNSSPEAKMDYTKSGVANTAKQSPKPKRGANKGAPKTPASDKQALLDRMKAAAAKKP
jgi:hypothetical protein